LKNKILVRRRSWLLPLLVIAALFLARPRAGRQLRDRASESLGQALGRTVEVGALHLRFLPRPGFALDNVVVSDDPRFGAEPLVRAREVTAWLRVTALLRHRVEISTLSLSDASLNLTRDEEGKWNLEQLIDRTARGSTAPTSSGRAEPRPKFPYVEAADARINFKIGSEKTHFAFTNAEFALWQESENAWAMRLRARPMRTDANLTDTGTALVNGLWERSPTLGETPLEFSFLWKQAQIGQLSKLVYGTDQGWRGSVALSGTARGTPQNLRLTVDGSVDNFRRQEVVGGRDLHLTAHCTAVYNSAQKSLANLDCAAPAGGGLLEVKGGATPSASPRLFSSYRLWLVANKVDAESALVLARQAIASPSDDLVANGSLDATVEISRDDRSDRAIIRGQGRLQELELRSAASDSKIALGTVPFELVSPRSDPAKTSQPAPGRGSSAGKAQTLQAPARSAANTEPHIEVGPVSFQLGSALPLEARSSLSRSGYEVSLRGAAGLKRLLEAAQVVRMKVPQIIADGSLAIDLRMAGAWKTTSWPKVLGTAHLRSVEAQIRGTNRPLRIVSATVVLSENMVRAQNLSAIAAETTWRGSLEFPRPCPVPSACQFQFSLHTPELNASALNSFLNPGLGRQNWYRFLSLGKEQPPYLLEVHAAGKIAADRVILGKTAGTHFSAGLRLDGGEVTLENLGGEILGGKTSADWKANFLRRPPVYSGSGRFEGVSLAEVAELIDDRWIEGDGGAEYQFHSAGQTLDDLVNSAELTANFKVTDGIFPHVVLTSDSGPLRASSFYGNLHLQAGEFSFDDARLESADGVYTLRGTALLDGTLDLKIAGQKAGGFNLTGTLVKTRVSPIQTAQASLKP
jgi:AsmA family/AsmA-like C-terminal region